MKFNKWGLAALPLLIMATSCNKETVESAAVSGKTIGFSTVLGKPTRATEMNLDGLKAATSFPVVAYTSGTASTTPYFSRTLSWSDPNWVLSGAAVIQPGYALTYYAWYPATTVTALPGTTSGTVAPVIAYTIPTTQEDLITATTTDGDNQVTLAFNHILSQVNFAIQGVQNMKVEITDLKINGVAATGNYTFTSPGSWADQSGTAGNYTYAYRTNTNITDGTNANISYMGNNNSAHAYDNALMLLPQDFASSTGNFSFDFTLKNMSDAILATGSDVAVKLSDIGSGKWEMGKRYLYIIDFTNYFTSGGQIVFTVTVADWVGDIVAYAEYADATKTSIEAAITQHNSSDGAANELKYFPIYLRIDPTATITLDAATLTNFDSGDQIRITCPTTTGAAFIAIDPTAFTGWTMDNTTAVVTITKD